MITVRLTVNGIQREAEVEPRLTLADLLRDRLRLTGTHLGCEHGVCGACTVLDGAMAIRSCLVLAGQADGMRITTVEGLAPAGEPSDLQREFMRAGAFQCGFCTPGFLATAEQLLADSRPLDRDSLRELLAGNLCRCTGYEPIIDAILAVRAGRT